ncbi:MAG: phosphate ABC transporter ATP-binding protein [Proteobacteria bacterium]|jgi:D-methionine transport system ATP-binding protein|nr:MAG: phosphate ABC transporter ATP-binding protein [Pseudomonadota bacterium]
MNAPVRTEQLIAVEGRQASKPIIEFQGVSKTYRPRGGAETVTALKDVSFTVQRGDIFGVIGRSGAGKSTLIRLINGLERATAGRVVVDGVDITGLSERDLIHTRRKTGMIFQHFNLLSSRTAFGNVALPLEIAGRSREEIKRRVPPLLELVGLADKHDRYPSELSGGQKQRVGIARALATEPSVLLCDEATSALDPETTSSILALLSDVNRTLGVTIVLITHEIPVIQEICNRVAVLDAGRIVEQGRVLDVFLKPSHPITENFVRSVTGLELPAELAARLQQHPQTGGSAILQVTSAETDAGTLLLNRLATALGDRFGIVAGRTGTLSGKPFAAWLITVPSETSGAALEALSQVGQDAKVIGYVS